ncbi:MAG: HAD family phosphatase [Pseudomonadota bacterium]
MTAPQAYLFDMDGLLLDTEQAFLDAALTLLVPMGHAAAEVRAFFLECVGSSSAMTRARLGEFLGAPDHAERVDAEWRRLHKARLADHVPLRPTVAPALAALRTQGARMAVVTSTWGEDARHHLAGAGLLEHFEFVLGGDEVRASKPDPAPYLEAAQALGVAPDACAAFEDSDRGITAAVRAGCRAVQVPDLRPAHVPLPRLGQHVARDLWSAIHAVGGTLGPHPT